MGDQAGEVQGHTLEHRTGHVGAVRCETETEKRAPLMAIELRCHRADQPREEQHAVGPGWHRGGGSDDSFEGVGRPGVGEAIVGVHDVVDEHVERLAAGAVLGDEHVPTGHRAGCTGDRVGEVFTLARHMGQHHRSGADHQPPRAVVDGSGAHRRGRGVDRATHGHRRRGDTEMLGGIGRDHAAGHAEGLQHRQARRVGPRSGQQFIAVLGRVPPAVVDQQRRKGRVLIRCHHSGDAGEEMIDRLHQRRCLVPHVGPAGADEGHLAQYVAGPGGHPVPLDPAREQLALLGGLPGAERVVGAGPPVHPHDGVGHRQPTGVDSHRGGVLTGHSNHADLGGGRSGRLERPAAAATDHVPPHRRVLLGAVAGDEHRGQTFARATTHGTLGIDDGHLHARTPQIDRQHTSAHRHTSPDRLVAVLTIATVTVADPSGPAQDDGHTPGVMVSRRRGGRCSRCRRARRRTAW